MRLLKIDQAIYGFQCLVCVHGVYVLWDAYRDLIILLTENDAGKYGALRNHSLTLLLLVSIYLLLGVWRRERIRSRETIEAIGDGFALLNREQKLIRCNTAFASVHGSQPPQLEQHYLHDILNHSYQQGKGFVMDHESFETWFCHHYPQKETPDYRTSEVLTWNGRCLLVTERSTSQGERVIVHTDITNHQHQKEELRRLATYDALTGILNRRSFMQQAEEWLRHCRQLHQPLSLMMLDVDHFKDVNDTYGHGCGDHVLSQLTQEATRLLRKVDLSGRLGGEEFAFLLPNTDGLEAKTVAERLRGRLKRLSFRHDLQRFHITVSIGIAVFDERDQDVSDLLNRADTRLYQAKMDGRDRVCTGLERLE